MSEEGKNEVVEIQPDKDGKYPETVPWNQYVGIKESLGHKLDSEKQKVTSLEEQLKKAVDQEEFNKVKQELEDTKTKLTTKETELNTEVTKSLGEKRNTLIKRGVPEAEVNNMSLAELNAAMVALQHVKPAPDMGGGGQGAQPPVGNPYVLATEGYKSSNK